VRGDPLATDQSQPTSHRYLAFYHLAPRTLPPPNLTTRTTIHSNFCRHFLDILSKNYLLQYIDKPTRIRGDDEPHVLDLVVTNEPFIAGIDFLSLRGKSDHSVLNIHCTAQVRETTNVVKYNYTKGDYDSLRISCQINWEVVVVDIC